MSDSPHYNDFVFKDGKMIGEFEAMYRECTDPWGQSTSEDLNNTERFIAINSIKRNECKTLLDIGCGLGHFTNIISQQGVKTIGVDVSETAIRKARTFYPNLRFEKWDVKSLKNWGGATPDAILMYEITWYIIDDLRGNLDQFKQLFEGCLIFHFLSCYPPGEQKYAKEIFTDLNGIKSFFDMDYLEWGEIWKRDSGARMTYFIGKV